MKITGLTEEEIEERKRYSRLVEIAKDVFPGWKISEPDTVICIYPIVEGVELSKPFFVNLSARNLIRAPNEVHLSYAKQLAEAYEASGEEEFTVKTEYER